LQRAYASTIRRVLPSVVEIRTASGLGSEVVYDTAGHCRDQRPRGRQRHLVQGVPGRLGQAAPGIGFAIPSNIVITV